jgi:hypothetical protein
MYAESHGIARIAFGLMLVALGGCAQSAATTSAREGTTAKPPAAVGVTQAELEAAQRHPIATPEPRSLYPETQPPARPARGLPEQAPPPRPERGLPEQAPPATGEAQPPTAGDAPQSAASSEGQPARVEPAAVRVVAPQAPPEPQYEVVPVAPAPAYVWAPGYWYWYDYHYVWIPGAWMPRRAGYVYVSARWVYGADGWVFAPGGWALSGGGLVVYPVYRHDFLFYPHHHRQHALYPNYVTPRRHYSYDYGRRGDRTWVRPNSRSSGRTRVNAGSSRGSSSALRAPRSASIPSSGADRTRVRVPARRR